MPAAAQVGKRVQYLPRLVTVQVRFIIIIQDIHVIGVVIDGCRKVMPYPVPNRVDAVGIRKQGIYFRIFVSSSAEGKFFIIEVQPDYRTNVISTWIQGRTANQQAVIIAVRIFTDIVRIIT